MYFFTLGQFQFYSLRNNGEDWVNNAQLFEVEGTNKQEDIGKLGRKLWIRIW